MYQRGTFLSDLPLFCKGRDFTRSEWKTLGLKSANFSNHETFEYLGTRLMAGSSRLHGVYRQLPVSRFGLRQPVRYASIRQLVLQMVDDHFEQHACRNIRLARDLFKQQFAITLDFPRDAYWRDAGSAGATSRGHAAHTTRVCTQWCSHYLGVSQNARRKAANAYGSSSRNRCAKSVPSFERFTKR